MHVEFFVFLYQSLLGLFYIIIIHSLNWNYSKTDL